MNTSKYRIAAVATAAAALIGGSAGIASASTGTQHPAPHPTFSFQPPHGSRTHCNPLYAAYDGFQVNGNGYALVAGGAFIPGFSQLQGTRHAQGCGQFWFSPNGDGNKAAVLTDGNGDPGTQVIGEGRGHRLVIDHVTTGSQTPKADQWTAVGTGGPNDESQWKNVNDGWIITIDQHGHATLTHPGTTPNDNNSFTFTAAH